MKASAQWFTLSVALLCAGTAVADDWRSRNTAAEPTTGTPASAGTEETTGAPRATGTSGVTLQPIRLPSSPPRQPLAQPAQTSSHAAAQLAAEQGRAQAGLRRAEHEVRLVSVPMPSLQVSVRGPLQLGLRERATFDILVTNSSRQILDVAHLSTAFGPGLRVRAISRAGDFDGEMNTMSWKLSQLLPGETQTVRMSVEAVEPGEQLQWVVAAPPAGAFVEYRHLTQVAPAAAVPMATYPTTATPAPPRPQTRGAASPAAAGSLPQRTPFWQRYNGDVVR